VQGKEEWCLFQSALPVSAGAGGWAFCWNVAFAALASSSGVRLRFFAKYSPTLVSAGPGLRFSNFDRWVAISWS
jgi:hypothetical protein